MSITRLYMKKLENININLLTGLSEAYYRLVQKDMDFTESYQQISKKLQITDFDISLFNFIFR